MIPLTQLFSKTAPQILLGAFFLCTSCKDEPAPVRPEKADVTPAASEPQTPAPDSITPPESSEAPLTEAEATPAPIESPSSDQIRFMAYNLKNYLTMDVYLKGGIKEARPKDPKEVAALIDIIIKENPQILGICEIGTKEDLSDLQSRLKAAGLDLPHSHYAGGMDTTRHLGFISALPITAGLVSILAGVLHLGRIAEFFSASVLTSR